MVCPPPLGGWRVWKMDGVEEEILAPHVESMPLVSSVNGVAVIPVCDMSQKGLLPEFRAT